MTVALLNDLKAEVIFLPKSANTIFDNFFTYYLFYVERMLERMYMDEDVAFMKFGA